MFPVHSLFISSNYTSEKWENHAVILWKLIAKSWSFAARHSSQTSLLKENNDRDRQIRLHCGQCICVTHRRVQTFSCLSSRSNLMMQRSLTCRRRVCNEESVMRFSSSILFTTFHMSSSDLLNNVSNTPFSVLTFNSTTPMTSSKFKQTSDVIVVISKYQC